MTSYPMIYYRTSSTPNTNPTYATPALMLANASSQCIVFSRPKSSLDSISTNYKNNINYFNGISNDGSRISNIQDNGFGGQTLTLNGVFTVDNGTSDLNKLAFIFAEGLQTDTIHTKGHIGFYSPNAPYFSVDPAGGTFAAGYSIKELNVNRATKVPNLYVFSIILGLAI